MPAPEVDVTESGISAKPTLGRDNKRKSCFRLDLENMHRSSEGDTVVSAQVLLRRSRQLPRRWRERYQLLDDQGQATQSSGHFQLGPDCRRMAGRSGIADGVRKLPSILPMVCLSRRTSA